MENKIIEFPEDIHDALLELAKEYKMKLRKETHYEARDRELKWYTKNIIHRLNFDFSEKDSIVSVTHLIDRFPLPLTRLFEWCHDYIPLFPYCAKITWKRMDNLGLGLKKDEYKIRIRTMINEL